MKIVNVDLGYQPRPFQLKLHKKLKRFNVCVAHRRFGKTVMAIRDMMDRGFRCPLNRPQLAYVAPTYRQAKQVAWEYFKEFVRPLQHIDRNLIKIHEQELRIDIQRPSQGDFIRFFLLGSDNYDALKGIYLDWAILDEFALCDPALWGTSLRPALSDRQGGAMFIGTPKGQNHFFDMYRKATELMNQGENWFSCILKASETKVISQEELDDAKQTMTDEEYRQEYECDFSAALIGAYYGKQINLLEQENQIIDFPIHHDLPVQTFWDLGLNDSTAIWFAQIVGKEVHIIDYMEDNGIPLPGWAKRVLEKPYTYSQHVLPHDAGHRELSSGKSREQALNDAGLSRTTILQKSFVEDGIDMVRNLLPRCWFHKTNTEKGILCLKNYTKKWDAKKKVYSPKAEHNWASHGADAFRILAMGLQEKTGILQLADNPSKLEPLLTASGDYDIFSNFR